MMLTFKLQLVFTSHLTSYFHLQTEPAILTMGEQIGNDKSAIKEPISSETSLQTPVKVLHFHCLD